MYAVNGQLAPATMVNMRGHTCTIKATALDTSCKHQEVDAENLEYFGEKLMDFYRSFADL